VSPPALPNLALTITPPGGSPTNYTSNLAYDGGQGQMTINQNFGRQGDTASFVLLDDWSGQANPSFHIPVLSQIKLYDNTIGTTLFAGVVTDPQLLPTAPRLNEWDLSCVDYTYYADNAIVQGIFVGQSVDQILVALTEQANCGINAATVANGGYVAPGPVLPNFVLNYKTLSDAWRQLATLAGQVTPYGWYVDEFRNLHFYDATTAIASGVTFTTSPTSSGLGSTTEAHYDWDQTCTYEWDGTSIRNHILVQGATQTITAGSVLTTNPTQTWVGNGWQQAWQLAYTLTGSPSLYVNGVSTAVTVVNAGATGSGTWQMQQNSIGAWSLVNTAGAPAAGVVIKLWYSYQVPVVASANDYPSQAAYTGPNRGVMSEFISDSSLSTTSMALARAQRERTEYGVAVERITFTTTEDWFGWIRAGETCTVVNQFVPDSAHSYSWGLTDTFIVVANTVSFGRGGYRTMQPTAVRL
jgi:hypothetical protein